MPLTPVLLAALGCRSAPPGQAPPAPPVEVGPSCRPWSDPETWGGELPAPGACVTVPAGVCVVLDVDGQHLASLVVEGRLELDDRDLRLTADWITVHGELAIGSDERPFLHEATIELVDDHARRVLDSPTAPPSPNGFTWAADCDGTMVRQASGLPPGTLEVTGAAVLDLHGEPRGPSWVRLAEPAEPGDQELALTAEVPWAVGDTLAVASTDFDMNLAEEVEIAAVDGARVTLAAPLLHPHFAGVARDDLPGGGVEMAAEVARLTRNVRIVGGSPDPVPLAGRCALPDCACTWQECHCPEVRPEALAFASGQVHVGSSAAGTPTVRIEDVELVGLGRYGELGSYPLHFHELEHPTELRVRRTVVRGSSNRAIVVHGTAGALLEENVAWDVVGSAFYLERSTEGHRTHENRLERNLAGSVHGCNPLDEGNDRDGPGAFWAADPDNDLVGNVSAGSDYAGFYLDHRVGDPCEIEGDPPSCESRFEGNTAHSSLNGFYANEHRHASEVQVDSTAWKIGARAFWLRNHGATELLRPRSADSGTGLYLASHAFYRDFVPTFDVTGAVILGETANTGVPRTDDEVAYGRTVPVLGDLLGVEVYEGRLLLDGATFAGFPEERRVGRRTLRSAAFGRHHDFLFYDNDPLNAVRDLTFVDAHPLWYAAPLPGAGGTSSVALLDLDGTLRGEPGSWFVADDPFHDLPGLTRRRGSLQAIEVPAEVGLVQLLVDWVDPEEPVPQAWGRARTVRFDRLEGGAVVASIVADLSKDGVHRQQAVNVVAGSEVAVHFLAPGGDEVPGFDDVGLTLRHGPPGASLTVHVPLEHADWAGTVWRGLEPVDPSAYTFDPATVTLSTTLAIGGVGDTPRDRVADDLEVRP